MSLELNGTKYTPPGAITSLIDSTTGVVNNTVEAIPDPTGALVTDLITSLTSSVLPAVRNDLADLTSKVNEILVVLRNNGMIT